MKKRFRQLSDFFENYRRIEQIKLIDNGYIIKGCNKCISEGIIVRKQDCPGFLGKLNEIKYVIVGLEANIPNDIHIAFNQFETKTKEHQLFARLKLLLHDIKDKAYVTDIAKCNSSNLRLSRKICFETHFHKELKMLLEFNPDLKIIFQGTTVEDYFSNNLEPFSTIDKSNDEVKSGNNFLFKRQYLSFDSKNKKIPFILILSFVMYVVLELTILHFKMNYIIEKLS